MDIAKAPYMKAMIPRNAMSDFGRYGVGHNGAFELRFFNWVPTLGNPSPSGDETAAAERAAINSAAIPALVEVGKHVQEYVRGLPLRAGTTPLKFTPDYQSWLIKARAMESSVATSRRRQELDKGDIRSD